MSYAGVTDIISKPSRKITREDIIRARENRIAAEKKYILWD